MENIFSGQLTGLENKTLKLFLYIYVNTEQLLRTVQSQWNLASPITIGYFVRLKGVVRYWKEEGLEGHGVQTRKTNYSILYQRNKSHRIKVGLYRIKKSEVFSKKCMSEDRDFFNGI